ncbi:MAG: hypothetical protein K9K81_01055 [Desulfobacteraceae bacterium]|nr:hypothetical protein [Desulfobacteraceae bacterium]
MEIREIQAGNIDQCQKNAFSMTTSEKRKIRAGRDITQNTKNFFQRKPIYAILIHAENYTIIVTYDRYRGPGLRLQLEEKG